MWQDLSSVCGEGEQNSQGRLTEQGLGNKWDETEGEELQRQKATCRACLRAQQRGVQPGFVHQWALLMP